MKNNHRGYHHHLPRARAVQTREGLPVLLFELPAFEWKGRESGRLQVRLGMGDAVGRETVGMENARSFHEAPLAA